MKQFAAFTRLELFFNLKRNGFRINYLLFAGLVFLWINIIGGTFPQLQTAGDNTKLNSPGQVMAIMFAISLISTFVVASTTGRAALRDYAYHSHEIVFTYPVRRMQYIAGKLAGAYLSLLLLFTAPILGHILACKMPWMDPDLFLPFDITTYWKAYFQVFMINLLFMSAIFFSLSLLARNIVLNWVVVILLYIMYYLGIRYFLQTGTRTLGALLDPYGMTGLMSRNVGQGVHERLHHQASLTGLYLLNRLIWLGVGLLTLTAAVLRFRFHYQRTTIRLKLFKRNKILTPANKVASVTIASPLINLNFKAVFLFKGFFKQLALECRRIFKNAYFYLILGAGILFLILGSLVSDKAWETASYTTTIAILEIFTGIIDIFIILLILIFSGESVWRDAQYRLDGIIGALPVPRFLRFAAKTTALYILVLLMLSVTIFAGICYQYLKGYDHYQLSLYIIYLFGYSGIRYLFYCILAIGLQSIATNKYVGYVLFGGLYIFSLFFGTSLLGYGVLVIGYAPEVTYSDITGFQGSFYPFYVFIIYWLLFATIIWRAAIRMFPSQEGLTYKERLRFLTGKKWHARSVTTWLQFIGFFSLGMFIFYNTTILNKHYTQKQINVQRAAYEKKYGYLLKEPQLSIVRVNGQINLTPSLRKADADMILVLQNKTIYPVHNIYLLLPDGDAFSNIKFSAACTAGFSDKDVDFYSYKLNKPLATGDSIQLTYHFHSVPKGFTDAGVESPVNTNGTFMNSGYFIPMIGYSSAYELNDNRIRKKYGLRSKPYMPTQEDSIAKMQSFFGADADRVWMKLTLSTESGQTAIAPGYLVKQWNTGDRSFYTYEMDQPAINFFSIQSGHFKVKSEYYTIPGDTLNRPVQLSIYYHEQHSYNIGVMMQAMKDALTYYSNTFSPYQYRQLRIIEFPASSFAQSFANTIAFSENIGFLADLRDTMSAKAVLGGEMSSGINYVYDVTAHETAHQWWGHQILPANTNGAPFLSETMSQYSSTMAFKDKYGEEEVAKLLAQESFTYLSERGTEEKEEFPLAYAVNGQDYIYYRKGNCIMYALQKYLGEETVNKVYKDFIRQYGYKERPYVTSQVLVNMLKNATPDSLKYLVTDCLERVVLYDNKLISASYKLDTETMAYTVHLTIDGKKLLYNNNQAGTAIPMNDWIELGILNNDGKRVATQKIRIRSGRNNVIFTSGRRPASLLLNPDFDLQEKEYNIAKRKIAVSKE